MYIIFVQDTLSDTKNKSSCFFTGSTEENFFSATGRLHCRYHFSLAGLQLPSFLMNSFQYIGNLTTPLSLVFIGIEMSKIVGRIGFDKDLLLALPDVFLVCPVCVLALVPLLPVTPLSAQIFTMQATMPAMTQMAIVAKNYGADSAYAATLSFLTVLLGIVVVPLYMMLVNMYI